MNRDPGYERRSEQSADTECRDDKPHGLCPVFGWEPLGGSTHGGGIKAAFSHP
jgi:hypothetical protein